MIDPNLPGGWTINPGNSPNLQFDFWKAYPTPDGLEVDVYVVTVHNLFQVKTEAASRSTIPTEAVLQYTSTLDEALAIAYGECKEWDDFVAEHLAKNQSPTTKS